MYATSVAFAGVPLETHSSAGRRSTRRFAAQRNGHAQDARGLPAAAACAAACTCRHLARGRAWGGRSSPRGADARGTGASGAGARGSEARGWCGGAAACAPGQKGPELTAKVNAGGQRGIWEARERQAVQRSCNGRFCCSNARRMCQQGRSNVSTPRSALRRDSEGRAVDVRFSRSCTCKTCNKPCAETKAHHAHMEYEYTCRTIMRRRGALLRPSGGERSP